VLLLILLFFLMKCSLRYIAGYTIQYIPGKQLLHGELWKIPGKRRRNNISLHALLQGKTGRDKIASCRGKASKY
jgi:hypothetical protein